MVGGILFVCHANLCRSPMAEFISAAMLAKGLDHDARLAVRSAGTHAVPGLPMHPHAAGVAAERGTDPQTFRSRRLTAGDITGADLVLTATRQQRTACAVLAPRAMGRTFTLRQFTRLTTAAVEHGWRLADADEDPARRLAALVAAAAAVRGKLQPGPAAAEDLADPIGQPIGRFRQCAQEIEEALRPIVEVIGGSA